MSDAINPTHYKRLPVEAIEIIESAVENAPSNKAASLQWQVLKYLLRCNEKGQHADDLRKAKWYLDRLVESLPCSRLLDFDQVDISPTQDSCFPFDQTKSPSQRKKKMSTIDPGPGYRIVHHNEPPQEGIEYWSEATEEWRPRATLNPLYSTLKPLYSDVTYRIKVDPSQRYRIAGTGSKCDGQIVRVVEWGQVHCLVGFPGVQTWIARRCLEPIEDHIPDAGKKADWRPKVGDWVRIVKPAGIGPNEGWYSQEMDAFCGKSVRVESVFSDHVGIHGWCFYFDWLEPCEFSNHVVDAEKKVDRTTEKSSTVEPGEGWRLLDKNEMPQKGDECLDIYGKWIESENWITGCRQADTPYRRRIESDLTIQDFRTVEATVTTGISPSDDLSCKLQSDKVASINLTPSEPEYIEPTAEHIGQMVEGSSNGAYWSSERELLAIFDSRLGKRFAVRLADDTIVSYSQARIKLEPKPEPKYRDVTASDIGKTIEVRNGDQYGWIEKTLTEIVRTSTWTGGSRLPKQEKRYHCEHNSTWRQARIVEGGEA